MKSAAMCSRWCVYVTLTRCCEELPACKGQSGKRRHFVPPGLEGAGLHGGSSRGRLALTDSTLKNASIKHAACLLHGFLNLFFKDIPLCKSVQMWPK